MGRVLRPMHAGRIMLAFCFTDNPDAAGHRFDGTPLVPAGYHSCSIISMSYVLHI